MSAPPERREKLRVAAKLRLARGATARALDAAALAAAMAAALAVFTDAAIEQIERDVAAEERRSSHAFAHAFAPDN